MIVPLRFTLVCATFLALFFTQTYAQTIPTAATCGLCEGPTCQVVSYPKLHQFVRNAKKNDSVIGDNVFADSLDGTPTTANWVVQFDTKGTDTLVSVSAKSKAGGTVVITIKYFDKTTAKLEAVLLKIDFSTVEGPYLCTRNLPAGVSDLDVQEVVANWSVDPGPGPPPESL
jgi:hypothetical protein